MGTAAGAGQRTEVASRATPAREHIFGLQRPSRTAFSIRVRSGSTQEINGLAERAAALL